ncbi:hypothetical protein C8R42DRAFT_678949 [Lentinula raphanica]|nr:hypothetical protein C8R42DRAFT_678949 [Lentinula raphanica]
MLTVFFFNSLLLHFSFSLLYIIYASLPLPFFSGRINHSGLSILTPMITRERDLWLSRTPLGGTIDLGQGIIDQKWVVWEVVTGSRWTEDDR